MDENNQNKVVDKERQKICWQKNKRLFMIAVLIILILLLIFTLAVYLFGWDWTCLTRITGPALKSNEQYRPAKTLWDVLQLLIVSIILAFGGFWLNRIQSSREQRATEQQVALERELTRDIQREILLQTYIDKMSELLLKEGLHQSESVVTASLYTR